MNSAVFLILIYSNYVTFHVSFTSTIVSPKNKYLKQTTKYQK